MLYNYLVTGYELSRADPFAVDNSLVQRLTALMVAKPEEIAPSAFDHLVSLTAKVMQCEKSVVVLSGKADPEEGDIALISLSGSLHSPLVELALESDEAFVISDLHADERFSGDPLVVSYGRLGYFACAPLIDSSGERVGTLCVADSTPRKWQRSNERDAMDALAGAIVADMALDESRLEVLYHRTELRRLTEIQAMKDDFVATVSHELRTPLTSIAASLGLLEDGILGPLPEDVLEVVRVATSNSARLVALVDDLLDLERMDSGALEIALAPASITEIIDAAINAVIGSAEKIGIALSREDRFEPGARVECDGKRIIQVLVNLLGNAIKFAKPETEVTLRTEMAEHDRLVFSVIDWGSGIAEASLSRLFDPFWQDDSSASRATGGSGLGLAISKKIVDQHHGKIEVDSTLGVGSTFRVVLPLTTQT